MELAQLKVNYANMELKMAEGHANQGTKVNSGGKPGVKGKGKMVERTTKGKRSATMQPMPTGALAHVNGAKKRCVGAITLAESDRESGIRVRPPAGDHTDPAPQFVLLFRLGGRVSLCGYHNCCIVFTLHIDGHQVHAFCFPLRHHFEHQPVC